MLSTDVSIPLPGWQGLPTATITWGAGAVLSDILSFGTETQGLVFFFLNNDSKYLEILVDPTKHVCRKNVTSKAARMQTLGEKPVSSEDKAGPDLLTESP